MKTDKRYEKRKEMLPLVAKAFACLGYRRATTSAIANECGVKEAILYRLWEDKKAMFVASVKYLTDNILEIWERQISKTLQENKPLEVLFDYESTHFAELGHYMIIFSGLNEVDEPDIKKVLQEMYNRIHRYLVDMILSYYGNNKQDVTDFAESTAWRLIGIGTMITIGKHLELFGDSMREKMLDKNILNL